MTMLAICLLAVGAFAADTQAPVISLDLVDVPKYSASAAAAHSASAIVAPQITTKNGVGLAVDNHFVDEVNLKASGITTGADHMLPIASTFDHHEGSSSTLTNEDVIVASEQMKCTSGDGQGSLTPCGANGVLQSPAQRAGFAQANWNTQELARAEYIAHWNAQDASLNDADTVAFSLIVTDVTKPTSSSDSTASSEWSDVASGYTMAYSDNYDTRVGVQTSANTLALPATYPAANEARYAVDVCEAPGSYTITTEVADSAGIFGANQISNVFTHVRTHVIEDTTPPSLELKVDQVTNFECAVDVVATGYLDDIIIATANEYSEITVSDGVDYTKANCASFEHCLTVAELSRTGASCASLNPAGSGNSALVLGDCVTTYEATDCSSLKSPVRTQTFTVVDTTAPVITHDHTAESIRRAHSGDGPTGAGETASISHYHVSANSRSDVGQKNDKLIGGGYMHKDSMGDDEINNLSGADSMGSNTRIQFGAASYGNADDSIVYHQQGNVQGLERLQAQLLDLNCADTCDSGIEVAGSYAWVDAAECQKEDSALTANPTTTRAYSLTDAGNYYLKFTCKDASDNFKSQCRTVVNDDATVPIIDIKCKKTQLGLIEHPDNIANTEYCDQEFLPMQGSENYLDAGAGCYTYKEGQKNSNIVTSGDVVDFAVPDIYRITYNCQVDGIDAVPAIRTVNILATVAPTKAPTKAPTASPTKADQTPPQCDFDGCLKSTVPIGHGFDDKTAGDIEMLDGAGNACVWEVDVEASFPFADTAPICNDLITGVADTIVTTGEVDVELTAAYTLTYKISDTNGNEATYKKVVNVKDSIKPTIELHYNGINLSTGLASDLMEENHFVNGWLVGAVASAITGVAMLAYSSKTSVATSVPV
jgi:hypothetical protein